MPPNKAGSLTPFTSSVLVQSEPVGGVMDLSVLWLDRDTCLIPEDPDDSEEE